MALERGPAALTNVSRGWSFEVVIEHVGTGVTVLHVNIIAV